MIRATTPTHVFNFSMSPSEFDKILITYKQGDEPVIEFTKEDLEISDFSVAHTFSEAETKLFDANKICFCQLRATMENQSIATKPYMLSIKDVLNDVALTDGNPDGTIAGTFTMDVDFEDVTSVASNSFEARVLVGLKGEAGPQGVQGPQGIQGPKSNKGDAGSIGFAKTITLSGWVDNSIIVSDSFFNSSDFAYVISPSYDSFKAFSDAVIKARVIAEGQMEFVCENTPSTDIACEILKVGING